MTRLLTLALILSVSTAHAEPELCLPMTFVKETASDAMRLRLPDVLSDQAERARRLRTDGIVAVVVGTVLTGVGVGLFVKGFCFDECEGSPGTFEIGAALLAIGQAAVLTGIPLWAVGQTRLDRVDRARLSLAATSARLTF